MPHVFDEIRIDSVNQGPLKEGELSISSGSDRGAAGVTEREPNGGALISREAITDLLRKWTDGDQGSLDLVINRVYDQLHRAATYCIVGETPCHTLQATALINETYLRLCKNDNLRFTSRLQFFSFASETMRRILVEHARARNRAKRGGELGRVPIDGQIDLPIRSGWGPSVMLALDKALEQVKSIDDRRYKVAVWWLFGGLNADEIGVLLGASASTVRRELRAVRCWLSFELRKK